MVKKQEIKKTNKQIKKSVTKKALVKKVATKKPVVVKPAVTAVAPKKSLLKRILGALGL